MVFKSGDLVGEGRYRIMNRIGSGGMGEVYAAGDLKLQGRLRAIKCHRISGEQDGYLAEEASMLMQLHHPGIPEIVDYFPPDADQLELLVMDYIDGVTLAEWQPALPILIQMGIELCQVLAYLHQQRPPIIHRDLKPSNVMVDHSGRVKLIDFGIARYFKNNAVQDTVKLGSPGFASPEQSGTGQSDPRTDIYGLGTLMYYLLANGAPPSLYAEDALNLPAHIPLELKEIVAKMLAFKPEKRYPNAEDAAAALQRCREELYGSGTGGAGAVGGRMPEDCRGSGKTVAFDQNGVSRSRTKQIAVASFTPGAGATTLSLALARVISLRQPVAAYEYYRLSPEWYAILHFDFMNRKEQAHDLLYFRRQERNIAWHARNPWLEEGAACSLRQPGPGLEQKFHSLYKSHGDAVSLLDLSGCWLRPEQGRHWAEIADELILVVDPYLSKWTPERLSEGTRLQEERRGRGLRTWWLANKDMAFKGRREWLDSIPGSAAACMPQIAPEHMVHLLWNGQGAGADRQSQAVSEKALLPFVGQLFAGS